MNLIQKSFYDKLLLDRLKGAKNILIHPNLRCYQLKNQNKNIQEVPNQMEEKIIYDGIENKVEFFDTDFESFFVVGIFSFVDSSSFSTIIIFPFSEDIIV